MARIPIAVGFIAAAAGLLGEAEAAAQEVVLETPTGKLHATPAPYPVAIHPGSGPTDRDGNSPLLPGKNDSLKLLAEGLAARGIASPRVDERGIGKSAATREEDVRRELRRGRSGLARVASRRGRKPSPRPPRRRTAMTKQRISGRIGGLVIGCDVNLTWDGARLTGRIGGVHQSMNVKLSVAGGEVSGRVGGKHVGFDVRGTLGPSTLSLRLGGATLGEDLRLELELGRTHFTGRLGGPKIGHDVSLRATVPNRLSGRIGGRLNGKDVRLTTDAPLEVAALAAVIAFEALEQDYRALGQDSGGLGQDSGGLGQDSGDLDCDSAD